MDTMDPTNLLSNAYCILIITMYENRCKTTSVDSAGMLEKSGLKYPMVTNYTVRQFNTCIIVIH